MLFVSVTDRFVEGETDVEAAEVEVEDDVEVAADEDEDVSLEGLDVEAVEVEVEVEVGVGVDFLSVTLANTSIIEETALSSSCFFSFLALILEDQISPPLN